MKAFLASIIFLVVMAFAFTELPKDAANFIKKSTNIDGWLRDQLAGRLAKRILPEKNDEETRLELIDKIQQSISDLELELSGVLPPEKQTGSKEIISEAEDLLEDLRSKNANRGLFRETAEKIAAGILSSKNQCIKEPDEE